MEPVAYCYRMYVGESTARGVLAVLQRFDLPATVYPQGQGMWGGLIEPVVVVEIIRDNIFDGDIRVIAEAMAHEFRQDCVLFTRTDVSRMELVKSE